MSTEKLIDQEILQPCTLTETVLRSRHRLLETEMFTDENLINTIDTHPRELCFVSCMGTDPERPDDWGIGETNGLNGAAILESIKKGRLWLNIRRIAEFQPEFGRIIDQLYRELEAIDPSFVTVQRSGNLVVSSPKALVYMHVDASQNMLWHLRGHKRIWIYPSDDDRFAPRDNLEAIVAHACAEDLPYTSDMDDAAECYDLEPGEWIIWPHNAPHRIENHGDLNVSLSTEHATPQGTRRLRVFRGNYFLKNRLGISATSIHPNGLNYAVKSAVAAGFIAAQKVGLSRPVRFNYPTTFRVDPDALEGIAPLEDS